MLLLAFLSVVAHVGYHGFMEGPPEVINIFAEPRPVTWTITIKTPPVEYHYFYSEEEMVIHSENYDTAQRCYNIQSHHACAM